LSVSRRALITGASSGIGSAFARALGARGERLVLVARRRQRLEALAAELSQDPGSVLVADLSVPGAAAGIAAETVRRGFEIDLLVNDAGLGHTARFSDESGERIAAMLQVNVRALVELTHAFLPSMIARGRGRIINVASNAAFQPVPFLTVYAATKAFVLSFTEGLATELEGTGVQIQALCPGLTQTEFLEVAETHTRGLRVNRMPTMAAEDVVKASLRGLDRGRVRVVAGLANEALAALQGVVPRSWVRRVAASLYRPPGG
jgi:short-subunit dehydrogenase